eukprot:INCI7178.6.p2 GENE.INCI7178.6~~INCI7178.6.p2  ORF type:complete len:1077 (-),score=223.95 INCI7178.6:6204-9434(-)
MMEESLGVGIGESAAAEGTREDEDEFVAQEEAATEAEEAQQQVNQPVAGMLKDRCEAPTADSEQDDSASNAEPAHTIQSTTEQQQQQQQQQRNRWMKRRQSQGSLSLQRIPVPSSGGPSSMFLRRLSPEELLESGVVPELVVRGRDSSYEGQEEQCLMLARKGIFDRFLESHNLRSRNIAETDSDQVAHEEGVGADGKGAATVPPPIRQRILEAIAEDNRALSAAIDSGDQLAALRSCASRDALFQLGILSGMVDELFDTFQVHALQTRQQVMELSMSREDAQTYLASMASGSWPELSRLPDFEPVWIRAKHLSDANDLLISEELINEAATTILEDHQQMLVAAEDAALNYRWSCATLKKCVQLWRTSTNNFKDRFNREALDREARLADDAKLNNVLNELLSTEKSFVAMLEELNHRYYLELRLSDGEYGISDDEVEKIFHNLGKLTSKHQIFAYKLEALLQRFRAGQDPDERNISDTFYWHLREIDSLHGEYVCNYSEVPGLLKELFSARNGKFQRFVEERYNQAIQAQMNTQYCNGLDISIRSLLQSPVTRLTRYQLLLKALSEASRPKIVSVSMCLDLIRRDVKFEPNGKVVAKVGPSSRLSGKSSFHDSSTGSTHGVQVGDVLLAIDGVLVADTAASILGCAGQGDQNDEFAVTVNEEDDSKTVELQFLRDPWRRPFAQARDVNTSNEYRLRQHSLDLSVVRVAEELQRRNPNKHRTIVKVITTKGLEFVDDTRDKTRRKKLQCCVVANDSITFCEEHGQLGVPSSVVWFPLQQRFQLEPVATLISVGGDQKALLQQEKLQQSMRHIDSDASVSVEELKEVQLQFQTDRLCKWTWYDDGRDQWKTFEPQVSDVLEAAFQEGAEEVSICDGLYVFKLRNSQQILTTNPTRRRIIRRRGKRVFDSSKPASSLSPARRGEKHDGMGVCESESVRTIGPPSTMRVFFDILSRTEAAAKAEAREAGLDAQSPQEASLLARDTLIVSETKLPSMGRIPALEDGVDNAFNIMCGGRSGAEFLRWFWQHRESTSVEQLRAQERLHGPVQPTQTAIDAWGRPTSSPHANRLRRLSRVSGPE